MAVPGLPPGSFDDICAIPVLQETDRNREAARIREDVLKSSFGRLDVRDWIEFNAPGCAPKLGDNPCVFEARYLREATTITKNALGPAAPKLSRVKITLLRNKLRFTTSSWAASADVQYPLLMPAICLENDEQISLILDHAILSKIAVSCPDATLNFVFHSDPRTLSIQAEKVSLDLCTLPTTEFTDHLSELGKPAHVCQINPKILHEAIRYHTLWAEPNQIMQDLSVVTIRDAQVIGGGTMQSIGLFKSNEFADMSLSLRYDHLSVLHDILLRFDRDHTHLFEF